MFLSNVVFVGEGSSTTFSIRSSRILIFNGCLLIKQVCFKVGYKTPVSPGFFYLLKTIRPAFLLVNVSESTAPYARRYK